MVITRNPVLVITHFYNSAKCTPEILFTASTDRNLIVLME